MLSCLYKTAILLRSRLCLLWGGFMRVPIHGAVYPISPNSDIGYERRNRRGGRKTGRGVWTPDTQTI